MQFLQVILPGLAAVRRFLQLHSERIAIRVSEGQGRCIDTCICVPFQDLALVGGQGQDQSAAAFCHHIQMDAAAVCPEGTLQQVGSVAITSVGGIYGIGIPFQFSSNKLQRIG